MISHELNFLLKQPGNFDAKHKYLVELNNTCDWVKPFILTLCAQGENPFSQKQLDGELTRLIAIACDKESKSTAPVQLQSRAKKEVAKYNPEDLPEPLKPVHNEIVELYSENRIMRGKLQQIHYDHGGRIRQRISKSARTEAGEYADLIVENDKRIASLYTRIDFFLDTGRIMGQKEESTELDRVTKWLSEILELNNYVKKCDTFYRKYKRYQNPSKYQESANTLSQIKDYLRSKGL